MIDFGLAASSVERRSRDAVARWHGGTVARHEPTCSQHAAIAKAKNHKVASGEKMKTKVPPCPGSCAIHRSLPRCYVFCFVVLRVHDD